MKRILASVLLVAAAVTLTACSEDEADPLEVTNSTDITAITDNTGTGWYTVDAARLYTNGLGTTLRLSFTITHTNGVKFNPVSTITFKNGESITCEADDLRRIPSLQSSTTDWEFACDAAEFPEDAEGATMTVIDSYN